MGVFQNNLLAGAAAAASAGGAGFYDHQIEQSLRIDSTSDYLKSGNNSEGASEKYTFSLWVKRGDLSRYQVMIGDSAGNWSLVFDAEDNIKLASHTTVETSGKFRDTNGWYHIVAGNGPNSGDGFIYVNGVQQTLASNTFNSNSGAFRSGTNNQIGVSNNGLYNLNGYIAEVYGFSNQTKAHTDFGEFKNGVWIPKEYTGSFGDAQDFFLKFENASDLGNDSSGNNNDFSVQGTLGADHQVLDSPTFGS